MARQTVTGVFNDAYIDELHERYQRDPASVDESWRQFFRIAERFGAGASPAPTQAPTHTRDGVFLRRVAAAGTLLQHIREYGHLDVTLDPLGSAPISAAELTMEFHDLTQEQLEEIPGVALGAEDDSSAAEFIERMRTLYSSDIGFEIEHLTEEVERLWFRDMIESERVPRTHAPEERRWLLKRLTEVDCLERFLGRAFVGHKRFSIEGTDVMVPMLDVLIDTAAANGADEVVIAMAHRGRINVLTHVLGKPYQALFREFAGTQLHANTPGASGDVKYHLGARGSRTMSDGRRVRVGLAPNPSHLEFVNPVLAGVARARQRVPGSLAGDRSPQSVVPVCIHGDAAFPGEGIVAETFNLAHLRGYSVGGTLHIIVNNQIGYTTSPADGRSTLYSSDVAKGFEVPIAHVNADNPEACIAALRVGLLYRERFGKDFLIDLVGYRRHGHNEGDEPAYTQPALYDQIKKHPTVRRVFADRLIEAGVIVAADADSMEKSVMQHLQRELDKVQQEGGGSANPEKPRTTPSGSQMAAVVATGVAEQELLLLNEQLLSWPENFAVHPRLLKQLDRRRQAVREKHGIDWGQAEALAFASLLTSGTAVRLSGQDAERGTFSHRHAVLHDYRDGNTYVPLQHLRDAKAAFEIYNSPLSEAAVMGFEYGFSTAASEALVLWEAQFGDFSNVAQPIMDQFMFSDRAKWGQDSSLVLLLPHGYEGQGPEHSSARLERFLQAAAEGNMRVAYPTSPAQYFHILRRQVKLQQRRPLVLMQPKSLLRMPEAASELAELATGMFRPVLEDAITPDRRKAVRRLVLCSGKIYYDIAAALAAREASARPPVAIVRVEELYPWPHDEIGRVVDMYPEVEEIVWAQEEPRNMGAWSYALPRLHVSAGNLLRVSYIGRSERASPAEGSKGAHDAEQKRIVDAVLDVPESAARRRTPARA